MPSSFSRTSGTLPFRIERRTALTIDSIAAAVGWARPTALVTGFWRSGTTWLQQCLADAWLAKTLFEPLSPRLPRCRQLIDRFHLDSTAAAEAFLPLPFSDDPRYADWRQLLDTVFAGQTPGHFALLCRQGLHEAFRRRFVVKCVRLALALESIADAYAMPIIHIRRHPAAVVASVLATDWTWHFGDVRIAPLLFEIGDGREQLLATDESFVRACDEDVSSRIAAYWAVTEAMVERAARSGRNIRIVTYEAAVTDPYGVVQSLSHPFGITPRNFDALVESPTTVRNTVARETGAAASQRNRLKVDNVKRIEKIVGRLFPAWDPNAHEA